MQTRLVVKRYSGGIYAAPPRETQRLFKQILFRNRVIFSWEVDREDVPLYVVADPFAKWESKFYPFGDDGVLPPDHPFYSKK